MALVGFIGKFMCEDHGGFTSYCRVGEDKPCPKCGKVAEHSRGSRKHQGLDYDQPILSQAAGIHPDQIPEAMRLFPHHKFAPDGRMVFENHRERERALKDIGMYDRDGGKMTPR